MKKWVLLFTIITLLQCCWLPSDDDTTTPIFSTNYEPILMSRPVFESSISVLPSMPIINSGKIYVIENLLFINEVNKGFHVFNNANPQNPTPLQFINAPGATDVAIKNDVLYINQAVDLVAISVQQTTNTVSILKRIKNTFPDLASPDGFVYDPVASDDVVVGWTLITN